MPRESVQVVVAKPGARAEVVTLPNTLAALQEAVGGCLELVAAFPLPSGVYLYVNEDGVSLGLEPNFSVSFVGARHRLSAEDAPALPVVAAVDGTVRGTVVASKMDRHGHEVGLGDAEAASVASILDRLRGLD